VWLALCTSDDRPALWAADRLRARGLSPLVVLTPELLHYSFRWQHRLRNDAAPSVEFTLADGQVIRGVEILGVLNRIAALPPSLVNRMAPEDRSYALQEWTAFHISWLSALPVPVLNVPVMQGLCGPWRHRSEWTWLAAQAGLRTAPFRQDGAAEIALHATHDDRSVSRAVQSVFVVDGRVVGNGLRPAVAAACASLGRLSRTRLLGISFDAAGDTFIEASPRADLRCGGEPLIAVLLEALTSRA
jgi:hypothetical protein